VESEAAQEVHSAEYEVEQAKAAQKEAEARAVEQINSAESEAARAQASRKAAEEQVDSSVYEARQAHAAEMAAEASAAQEVRTAESEAARQAKARKVAQDEEQMINQTRVLDERVITGGWGLVVLLFVCLVNASWQRRHATVGKVYSKTSFCNSNTQSLEEGLLDATNKSNNNGGKPDSMIIRYEVQPDSPALVSSPVQSYRGVAKPTAVSDGPPESLTWDVSEKLKSVLGMHAQSTFMIGESITSDEFTLKGVPGLRLRFYPAGREGAAAGNSTILLEIPSGWRISARLFLGDISGVCEGEMPYAGPDSSWGLKGDCPRPRGEFTTVSVEFISASSVKGIAGKKMFEPIMGA
jgi:hypothetical protein